MITTTNVHRDDDSEVSASFVRSETGAEWFSIKVGGLDTTFFNLTAEELERIAQVANCAAARSASEGAFMVG